MKIRNRSYPTPFASIQSTEDWIEKYNVRDKYPDAHPKWVGFEYDADTGMYFVAFVLDGADQYLTCIAETEDEWESEDNRLDYDNWNQDVANRTPEENQKIIDWLESDVSNGLTKWRETLRELASVLESA